MLIKLLKFLILGVYIVNKLNTQINVQDSQGRHRPKQVGTKFKAFYLEDDWTILIWYKIYNMEMVDTNDGLPAGGSAVGSVLFSSNL